MATEEYTLIIADAGSSVPADGSVTVAKLADYSSYTIIGRNAGTSGSPSAQTCSSFGFDFLTAADATAAIAKLGLSFPVATANIADGAVTLAKHANLAAYSVIGRNDASSGVPSAQSCTAYAFDFLTAADAAAARAKIGISLPLSVANGGSGATSLSGILKGNGTGAFTAVAAPSGTIVGTTDSQTLTNKVISGSSNTLSNIPLASAVTGTLPITNVGIDSATDIGEALADDDSIAIYNTSGTANRKSLLSRVWTYISGKLAAASTTFSGSNVFQAGSYMVATVTTVTSLTHTVTLPTTFVIADDDTVGGGITVTLPTAASASGVEILVLKKGTTGNVIIEGNGAETINGALNQTLTTQYESLKMVSDGTEWFVTEA